MARLPELRRRRVVLCLLGRGLFRCRKCHGLAYVSTREGLLDRTGSKLRELRRRMGDRESWLGGATDWYPGEKPTGTHWRTSDRLARQWHFLSDRWHLLWMRDLADLGVRMGRLAGDRGEADWPTSSGTVRQPRWPARRYNRSWSNARTAYRSSLDEAGGRLDGLRRTCYTVACRS